MTLPDFLVVGTPKSGTTSLYYYLIQHPDIFMSPEVKETHFLTGMTRHSYLGVGNTFVKDLVTELDDYAQLFKQAKPFQVVGEVCATYLYLYQSTIPRIKEILGDEVKIIISLRNPVDRAFSNYLNHVRDGVEPYSFERALEVECSRREKNYWLGYLYVGIGYYYDQVKAYLESFSEKQVFIFLFEDFKTDPCRVVRNIFQFLNVDETFVPNTSQRFNTSGVPKSRTWHDFLIKSNPIKDFFRPVLPRKIRVRLVNALVRRNLDRPSLSLETRQHLAGVYKEDILKLQDLIARDLSDWLDTDM